MTAESNGMEPTPLFTLMNTCTQLMSALWSMDDLDVMILSQAVQIPRSQIFPKRHFRFSFCRHTYWYLLPKSSVVQYLLRLWRLVSLVHWQRASRFICF